MMKKATTPLFRTPVEVNPPLRPIGVGDASVFLGSCFAEHIGTCFADRRLRVLVNPLGVMYNPFSLARILNTTSADENRDFVSHQGMWHTWLGDSSLSRLSMDECKRATNEALTCFHEALSKADNLFLTLGTSHYYIYNKVGYEVVANCHRLPSADFTEAELKVDEIVASLDEALLAWHGKNPRLQVIFTVSPYRYRKYGFHESQLSKSRLLLAVEALQNRHPEWISYFPAYEIVLDELRDYRFYAEDMLHPSEQAVQYIWQRFCEAWMTEDTKTYLSKWEPLRLALQHRPLHPEDPAFADFQESIQTQVDALQRDYPKLDLKHNLVSIKP